MANGYIPAEVERGCDPCRPARVEQKAFLGGVLGIDVNGERQPISEAGIVDLTFIEEETREAAEQAIASAQAAAESEQTASEAAASARSSESAAQTAANAAEAAKADAEDAASSANASKNTAGSYATAAQTAAAAAQVADGNAERSAESAIAAAAQAASSAGAAQQYANEAYTSASTAQTASGAAQDAQTAAEASASTASSAATTATQAATDAQTAQTAAEAAQSAAASSATAASGSATAAAGSATQAAASATAAAESAATLTLDDTLTSATQAAQAKAVGDELANVIGLVKRYFPNGNNLIPLSGTFEQKQDGITVKIQNGIVTLSGKRTVARSTWFKITNGYEWSSDGVPAEWLAQSLPQFQAGKTYSLHYLILSGTLPSGFGVVVKYASGTNMLSASIREASATETPASAQIATARNVDINVSFVPIIVEGGLYDEAYWAQLAQGIKVPGIKCYSSAPTLTNIYNSAKESVIRLPSAYNPDGEATPLIILCHGLTSEVTDSTWGAQTVADKFVNAGYAVMDVNKVTAQDWCNPALIAKYMAALNDILSKFNVSPKYVYGLSMGSLIGLCISTVVPGIKASAISGIRLDFEARYNELSSADKAIVDANLGFTNGFDAYKAAGWCKTAYACLDPNNNKINPIQFPPTIFIYGTDDTVTKTESLAKIDEIKRGGTICVANEYVGDHGDVCTLSAGTSLADTLAWFAQWA